jgi:O-antigen ligase
MAWSFAPGLLSLGATWVLAVALAGTAGNPGVLAGVLLLGFHLGLCFLVGAVRPADLRVVAGALLSLTGSGRGHEMGRLNVGSDSIDLVDRQASGDTSSSEPRGTTQKKENKVGLPR